MVDKPQLIVSYEAYQKMFMATRIADKKHKGEILWLLVLEEGKKGKGLTVTDIIIPEQTIQDSHCKMNIGETLSQKSLPKKLLPKLKGWGHSHRHMGCFYSPEDDETLENWAYALPYAIGIVCSLPDKMKAWIQFGKPYLTEKMELEVVTEFPETKGLKEKTEKELEQKIQKPKVTEKDLEEYAGFYDYGGNYPFGLGVGRKPIVPQKESDSPIKHVSEILKESEQQTSKYDEDVTFETILYHRGTKEAFVGVDCGFLRAILNKRFDNINKYPFYRELSKKKKKKTKGLFCSLYTQQEDFDNDMLFLKCEECLEMDGLTQEEIAKIQKDSEEIPKVNVNMNCVHLSVLSKNPPSCMPYSSSIRQFIQEQEIKEWQFICGIGARGTPLNCMGCTEVINKQKPKRQTRKQKKEVSKTIQKYDKIMGKEEWLKKKTINLHTEWAKHLNPNGTVRKYKYMQSFLYVKDVPNCSFEGCNNKAIAIEWLSLMDRTMRRAVCLDHVTNPILRLDMLIPLKPKEVAIK